MKQEYKIFPIRIEVDKHRKLRKLAYLREMSMASLIRNIIDEILNKENKVLTNSDIAI